MLNRLLVALIGIPILLYIYFSGGILLLLFTVGVVTIGTWEYYQMAENKGIKLYKKIGILFSGLLPIAIYFSNIKGYSIGGDIVSMIFILMFMILYIYRIFQGNIENASKEVGQSLFGIFYTSFLFSHILLISMLKDGNYWVLTIQILVWLCDSGAYFVGISCGRKIFKEGLTKISPKKSKEGSIGGIVIAVIGAIGSKYVLLSNSGVSLTKMIIIGIFIAVVAQTGDLVESILKRENKIKDSGRLLGEHGGILDRFDSMIFVLPVVYYALKYIQI